MKSVLRQMFDDQSADDQVMIEKKLKIKVLRQFQQWAFLANDWQTYMINQCVKIMCNNFKCGTH